MRDGGVGQQQELGWGQAEKESQQGGNVWVGIVVVVMVMVGVEMIIVVAMVVMIVMLVVVGGGIRSGRGKRVRLKR